MNLYPAWEDVIVVGIDPGLTTGWATLSSGSGALTAGQTEGRYEFYEVFDGMVGWGVPLVVVMEKFTITGETFRKSPQYDALYVVGAIDRHCHKLGIPFHCQTPADAKEFSTNEKLITLGWYDPSVQHGMDAARHVLLHMVTKRREFGGNELLGRILGRA